MESFNENQKNRDTVRTYWAGSYTEEMLLNAGYIKVKKAFNYLYGETILFCKLLEGSKPNERNGLHLVYWEPKNKMILDTKFYEDLELTDIEDSLEMMQKIFKPSLSDVINQLTKIVSEKVTKSS